MNQLLDLVIIGYSGLEFKCTEKKMMLSSINLKTACKDVVINYN